MLKKRCKIIAAGCLVILSVLFITGDPCFAQKDEKKKEPVGMVLETSGKVTVVQNGQPRNARLMMTLFKGDRIKTGSGGQLVMVAYFDDREYKIPSDSSIILKEKNLKKLKEKITPVHTASALPLPTNEMVTSRKILGRVVRVLYRGGVKILKPRDGQVLEKPELDIKWTGWTGKKVKIEICEEKEKEKKAVFSRVVKNDRKFTIDRQTGSFKLKPGSKYFLKLTGINHKEHAPEESLISNRSYNYVNFSILSSKKAKKLEAARKKFQEIIKKNPDDSKAYFLMSNLYKEYGIYDKAAELSLKLKKMEPENPYVYYFLGDIYKDWGKTTLARKMYDRGEELENKEKQPESENCETGEEQDEKEVSPEKDKTS